MAAFTESGYRTFTCGTALAAHARVKIVSGKIVAAVAGATDGNVEIGTVTSPAFADNDVRTVSLRNRSGTSKMIAGAAIAAGAIVYGAAAGKISATVSGDPIGISIDGASGDNAITEVIRFR